MTRDKLLLIEIERFVYKYLFWSAAPRTTGLAIQNYDVTDKIILTEQRRKLGL